MDVFLQALGFNRNSAQGMRRGGSDGVGGGSGGGYIRLTSFDFFQQWECVAYDMKCLCLFIPQNALLHPRVSYGYINIENSYIRD